MKKEIIKEVCNSIIDNDNIELFKKSQKELESYWFFKFDKSKSKESNLYEFVKMIDLYSNYCRRWEEHHHGHICVVERTRDKYIMPKIKEFMKNIK